MDATHRHSNASRISMCALHYGNGCCHSFGIRIRQWTYRANSDDKPNRARRNADLESHSRLRHGRAQRAHLGGCALSLLNRGRRRHGPEDRRTSRQEPHVGGGRTVELIGASTLQAEILASRSPCLFFGERQMRSPGTFPLWPKAAVSACPRSALSGPKRTLRIYEHTAQAHFMISSDAILPRSSRKA